MVAGIADGDELVQPIGGVFDLLPIHRGRDAVASGVVAPSHAPVRRGGVARVIIGADQLPGRVVSIGPFAVRGLHLDHLARHIIAVVGAGRDAAIRGIMRDARGLAGSVIAVACGRTIAVFFAHHLACAVILVADDQITIALAQSGEPAHCVIAVASDAAIGVDALAAPPARFIGEADGAVFGIGDGQQAVGGVIGVVGSGRIPPTGRNQVAARVVAAGGIGAVLIILACELTQAVIAIFDGVATRIRAAPQQAIRAVFVIHPGIVEVAGPNKIAPGVVFIAHGIAALIRDSGQQVRPRAILEGNLAAQWVEVGGGVPLGVVSDLDRATVGADRLNQSAIGVKLHLGGAAKRIDRLGQPAFCIVG